MCQTVCIGQEQCDVLWIDDQLSSEDPAVALLSGEGFGLDIARSAAHGLLAALTRRYDVIILDLHLPDGDGLQIVRRLHGVFSPRVMVLSGYLDLHTAGEAVRLGVNDLRSKPLYGDELVSAVRRLAHTSARLTANQHQQSDRTGTDADRVKALAVAVAREDLLPIEYINLARAMRRHLHGSDDIARAARWGVTKMRDRSEEIVHAALEHVQVELLRGVVPRLESVAGALHVDVDCVVRAFHTRLTSDFRECRRALRVRRGISMVGFTTEQSAQIAYRIGYHHPNQFARDFGATLGISPHEYRLLVADP